MSQHVASQIIAAVEARLAPVASVAIMPLYAIPLEILPAIVIENIEDETLQQIGPGPMHETHRLIFEVFGCSAATTGFHTVAGVLRTDIEKALLAASNDIRLGGLCRPGLKRSAALFRYDAESLQKPVGGWAMKFECVYQLKTDAPDIAI